MTEDLTIRHYTSDSAGDVLDVVIQIYTATHADLIDDDPFMSTERFLDRLAGYRRAAGFELVIANIDRVSVGLAFGYALPQNAAWWDGLITSVDPQLLAEDGRRTFALNEIMVRPEWQRRGIARALHTELMTHRPEQRATLLVRQDNTAAQTAYRNWGYESIGRLQPFSDAPVYEAMLLSPLPQDA